MIKSYEILNNNSPELVQEEVSIKLPLFWSEDTNGNINFDIDSIREICDSLIDACEEFNAQSEFDFDNC